MQGGPPIKNCTHALDKTATFVQKTTTIAADGTPKVATWYEALAVPGSLRIDFAPVSDGNGALFTGGKTFSFKDGKVRVDPRSSWELTPAICGRPSSGSTRRTCTSFE